MTPQEPEAPPKRKRRRRTKAEIEEVRQAAARAEAEKPVDPLIWIILGGLILFVALGMWLDPVTFAEAGQPSDWSIFQWVPLLLSRLLGRTPAIISLMALGALSLVWGIVGWVRKRIAPH